jgi:hypothetical protein
VIYVDRFVRSHVRCDQAIDQANYDAWCMMEFEFTRGRQFME